MKKLYIMKQNGTTHKSLSERQGGFTNLGLPLGFGTFTSETSILYRNNRLVYSHHLLFDYEERFLLNKRKLHLNQYIYPNFVIIQNSSVKWVPNFNQDIFKKLKCW